VIEKGKKIGSLDDSAGKPNKVVLLVLDDTGFLFVNNFFSGSFNLSQQTNAGDVMIGTAFYKENEKVGGTQTNYEDFQVWKMPVVHEPSDGELKLSDDNKLKTDMAGVDLKNFIAKATFSVPKGLWNVGFVFRRLAENDQFRLFAQSDSLWMFGNQVSHLIGTSWLSQGKGSKLKLGASELDELMLVALGDRSIFLVNGNVIAKPDLTARMNSGDIGVGTGFLEKDQITGQSIKYTDFTIWGLP